MKTKDISHFSHQLSIYFVKTFTELPHFSRSFWIQRVSLPMLGGPDRVRRDCQTLKMAQIEPKASAKIR